MKYLILLFLLGACGQLTDNTTNPIQQDIENIETENIETNIIAKSNGIVLDKSIVQTIKDYYHDLYSKEGRLEEVNSDKEIRLSYYRIPSEDNEYLGGGLIDINIYLTDSQELYGAVPILEGDLNNDQKNDLVVTVHTEGGGMGASVWGQDIFVFTYTKGVYKLADIVGDGFVSGCRGTFRAHRIENNFIIGESICFTESDARCCPSSQYETKVALKEGKLNHVSKIFMKKIVY